MNVRSLFGYACELAAFCDLGHEDLPVLRRLLDALFAALRAEALCEGARAERIRRFLTVGESLYAILDLEIEVSAYYGRVQVDEKDLERLARTLLAETLAPSELVALAGELAEHGGFADFLLVFEALALAAERRGASAARAILDDLRARLCATPSARRDLRAALARVSLLLETRGTRHLAGTPEESP